MPETRDPRSLVEAAEQAAGSGDYPAAERLLREAALLQEAALGPLHPDLANTLNNLGIVCEITGKPGDAEQYFRRACAIAAAVLEPDHPFAATSRKNLEDFCRARGKPVEEPPPAEPLPAEPLAPAAPASWIRPLTIGALVAATVVLALFARAAWRRSPGPAAETPAISQADPAPAAESPPAPPQLPPIAAGAATETRTNAAPRVRPPEGPGRRPPSVVAAEICRDLSTRGPRSPSGDWHCVPPGQPVGPGPLFFYTRLKSGTAATVQHRWYVGERLHQVVELPIRANTTDGYRTYSRTTIDNRGTGEWRVELRTLNGVLLHEEHFVVR